MVEILKKYLVLRNSISIPGTGTIYIERIPASADIENKQIIAPQYKYCFDKYSDTPDKDFFNYLSSQKKVAEYEAIELYNQFAQHIRAGLKSDEDVELAEIGRLKKNNSGETIFEAYEELSPRHMPVYAEKLVAGNTPAGTSTGHIQAAMAPETSYYAPRRKWLYRKTSWKTFALVLGATGIIILLIHFTRNGFTRESMTNQQRIDLQKAIR